MPKKDEEHRKRIVVEEIKEPQETSEVVETEKPAQAEEPPIEEVKEESTEENKSSEPEKPKEEKKEEVKEEPKSEPRKATEEKKSLWYIFWIMIPVAIIVGALAGGVFYFLNSVNKNAPSSTPTPIESSLPTPSSSPSAAVDLSKYQIKVLNGSGIAGEAGRVQDILTSAEFKVSGTGNAETYDFTDTILQVRDKVEPAFITELTKTLSKTYSVSDKTEALPSGETADVIVLVGSSKAAQ